MDAIIAAVNTIKNFLFHTSMASMLFFSQPVIERDANRLIITGKFHGAITEKVERIINTDTKVSVSYLVSIYSVTNNKETIHRKTIINSIKYNYLQEKYTLNLNGTIFETDDKKSAYNMIGIIKAEFEIKDSANTQFRDFYMDASIEYESSLKQSAPELNIPAKLLWKSYDPYIKVKGEIKPK